MLEVQFRAPNFRSKVRQKDDVDAPFNVRLLYADDEAAAREFLKSRSLEIQDLTPYNFQDWMDRAQEARTKALQEYPDYRKKKSIYEFKSALWGEIKDHLQDLFHDRCAYCEAQFKSVSFGDVEHYRPKAKVIEDPNHPGYYWLAYEPENYLPACQKCNTGGKKNSFPVKDGRASDPADDLKKETPLLINPYRDRHCDHVGYLSIQGEKPDLAKGQAFPRTEKGSESIRCYKLNRRDLVDARVAAQQAALFRFKDAINRGDRKGLKAIIQDCIMGKEAFCTAVAEEIWTFCQSIDFNGLFPEGLKLGPASS